MTLSSTAILARYASRIGGRIGNLVFQGVADQRGSGNRICGAFQCDCGETLIFPIGRVFNGSKTHCGCKTDHGTHRTHGMRGSPEYSSWRAMKDRCLRETAKDYPRWGGSGIAIHPGWVDSFDEFYDHLGPRPEGTSLDRMDGTKGYIPGNVRWATPEEQLENTKVSYFVEIDEVVYPSLRKAAKAHGVNISTIVDWCDGYTDPRRDHQKNKGHYPPRPNCRRWRKYLPED